MNKKLFLIFVISLVLSVGLASLRAGYMTILGMTGFPLSSLIGFILLGIGTAWCVIKYMSKIKPGYIILAIWLGVSILDLIHRLWHFSSSLISFPNLVIWWLGILVGFIYAIQKNVIARICLILASLIAVSWCCGPGYRMYVHKLNFGTFNGQVKEYIISPIIFNDQNNENVELTSLIKEYVVLDFWNSYCGICYQEFPEVQKLYDEIRNIDGISLYSVHCFRMDKEETYKTGAGLLQERDYSFPCISVPIDGYTVELLNIKVYPTVLIVDKNSNVIHRGSLKSALNTINKLNVGL